MGFLGEILVVWGPSVTTGILQQSTMSPQSLYLYQDGRVLSLPTPESEIAQALLAGPYPPLRHPSKSVFYNCYCSNSGVKEITVLLTKGNFSLTLSWQEINLSNC